MTEQTFETIAGVEGLVGVRVMDYNGQLCLEAEPQADRYRHGPFGSPPILRIPLENESPETVAAAKAAVPEGLTALFGA